MKRQSEFSPKTPPKAKRKKIKLSPRERARKQARELEQRIDDLEYASNKAVEHLLSERNKLQLLNNIWGANDENEGENDDLIEALLEDGLTDFFGVGTRHQFKGNSYQFEGNSFNLIEETTDGLDPNHNTSKDTSASHQFQGNSFNSLEDLAAVAHRDSVLLQSIDKIIHNTSKDTSAPQHKATTNKDFEDFKDYVTYLLESEPVSEPGLELPELPPLLPVLSDRDTDMMYLNNANYLNLDLHKLWDTVEKVKVPGGEDELLTSTTKDIKNALRLRL